MKRGAANRAYVLGESSDELLRLERQAAYFRGETEEALRRAGVAPGMRILDAGCGVGDVARVAAELVGPHGHVLGVDRVAAALDVAGRRMTASGLSNVSFQESELEGYVGSGSFDAVVSRFVLLHSADPEHLLRRLRGHVAPGGIIALMELDIGSMSTVPPAELFDRCIQWVVEVYRRGGYEPNMGSKLYATFKAAGLEPQLACTSRIEGGPNASGYQFIAQSIRSLMPSILALKIAEEDEIGIDSLAQRLEAEGAASDRCIIHPRFICGWATEPLLRG